jgi:predicted ATP-grasp superfamily ATP-dependent carboligase
VRDVFVYEYLSATGIGAGTSLEIEGRAMLAAVLADLGRVPGVQPVTLRAGACTGEEAVVFRERARACAFSLLIAPEQDGLLWRRCRWVEEAGGRLLGPDSDAVALTGDKVALARHLEAAGVPTPVCVPTTCTDVPFPVVCKPRDGVGSQATFLVRDRRELAACLSRARDEGWQGELVLQPFVPGSPVSVAFLLGPGQEVALAPAAQHLSADGRFHYLGGRVPLPAAAAARAVRLARQAVRAVPGLHGYVGVDLVLGGDEDGWDDRVIEINPRLTTSYVGLRALAVGNLMELLLRVVSGELVAEVTWRAGAVSFAPDGTVTK